jgi:hypothetical protein
MAQELRRRQDALKGVLVTQKEPCDRFGCITNANAIAYKVVSETSEIMARVGGIVSECEVCSLVKADQSTDSLGYRPFTMSAIRCEYILMRERRKLSAQTGWTSIVTQAA